MPTTYVQQLLFSVQHDFAGGILLDTSYVYTRGTNLNFATDINQAPPSLLGCTGYHCGNPNPVFNSIAAQIYDGWSNYNALQFRLQKRMSYGLNFQLNYAWSKSLDTGTGNGHGSGIDIYQSSYIPAANYGLSDFNAANTLVGQVTYELPFGHGRRFGLNGPLDQIVGGWRVSSLFQWHGGVPFTPVIQGSVAGGIDPGLTAGTLFPDVVGDPKVSSPTHAEWFNPAAFANPAYGTFGDAGRNNLIGPGFTNVNFSLAKEVAVFERVKLENSADMFDVFNHINWANPSNMSVLTSSFTRSKMANSFARLKFTLMKPGPIRLLRPASPKVPYAGLAKAAGLNHSAWVGLDTFGSPTTSGNSVPAVSPGSIPPATEPWITGVNGTPPCHWNRLETRQPPTIWSSGPLRPNRLPWPNGSS